MPYEIEVISIGGNFDSELREACQHLNGVQTEFRFGLPPSRYEGWGRTKFQIRYKSSEVFAILDEYLNTAKGGRRYIIGFVDQFLFKDGRGNLFGDRDIEPKTPGTGVAVVTLEQWAGYAKSSVHFICYYLIRYALSFVSPAVRSHGAKEKPKDCFFDYKRNKKDLLLSLKSGNLCSQHREQVEKSFNADVSTAFQSLVKAMKRIPDDSTDDLPAASVKGEVDVAILTIKYEETSAALKGLTRRRRVEGRGAHYSLGRVWTLANEELRVAIGTTSGQGQGPAQTLASSMINDLEPRWLIVVGIGGAYPATEFSLGDVAVSERIHDFSLAAEKPDGVREFEDRGRDLAPAAKTLVTDVIHFGERLGDWSTEAAIGLAKPKVKIPNAKTSDKLEGDKSWRKSIVEGLKANFPAKIPLRAPLAVSATIISSNTLVRDPSLAARWAIHARAAKVVEMEIAGALRAADAIGNANLPILTIRGISDVIGYKRDPVWTNYACQSAGAFAFGLLKSGFIKRAATSMV